MATPSADFVHLQQRVNDLAVKFVDDQVAAEQADPTTFQPDVDRIAAFKLLVHAEIEDYLERKARAKIGQHGTTLKAGNSVSQLLDLYVIAVLFDLKLPFDCPFDRPQFESDASALLHRADEFIADNNGIKGDSFKTLSVLSGKRIDEIDSTLEAMLASYGKARGEIAHRSMKRVLTINSPSTELVSVRQIVSSLSVFFYGI